MGQPEPEPSAPSVVSTASKAQAREVIASRDGMNEKDCGEELLEEEEEVLSFVRTCWERYL